jgi:uncharacterized protein involved in exopolysaccharide biosynthesis
MNTPMGIQPRVRELPADARFISESRGANPGQPLTLRDMLDTLKRRRKVALIFIGTVLGLVILYLCVATRRYAGEATLEFDKQNADMLALNGAPQQGNDALDYNITLQTQTAILESDTLALRLIKELNLEATADYKPRFYGSFSSAATFRGRSASGPSSEAPRGDPEKIPPESQGRDRARLAND